MCNLLNSNDYTFVHYHVRLKKDKYTSYDLQILFLYFYNINILTKWM